MTAATDSETPPPPKRRGSASRKTAAGPGRVVIVVPSDEVPEQQRPWADRVSSEIKTGGPGYLSSLAFHVALVLLLWAVVAPGGVSQSGGRGGAMIDAQLVDDDDKTGRDPNVPLARVPIFKNPVKDQPAPRPATKTRKKAGKTAGRGTLVRPVKPVPVKMLFANRDPVARERVFKELDPQQKIRLAISGGLYWLKRQQKNAGNWRLHEGYPDPGSFTVRTDTGATALALLAFLGDGHTHRKPGVHRETVAKGLKWLVGIQKTDGDFHEHPDLGRQSAFYAHAQATIAVCEAYAVTQDESLRKPAELAVEFLVKTQQPEQGGWKYQPQTSSSQGDLSVTGWALMALHTARAAGIAVPKRAFELSSRFLDSVQQNNGALYRYEAKPGYGPTLTMTAEGLLCRQFLGWEREHPALKEGVAYLLRPEHTPRWLPGGPARPHVYSWYYTGHVLHNIGGDSWKNWYDGVAKMIVERQSKSLGKKNDVRGSWNPKDPKSQRDYYGYGQLGGRLYTTTLCILVLELPIRHRSVYEK